MISLPLLTAALVVWLPYALASVPNEELRANAPNGELRMNIVRWVENKGKDVNRVVRLLDSSAINIEPNEPYVVHRSRKPIKEDETSEVIWRGDISEPGTWSLDVIRAELLEDDSSSRGRDGFGRAKVQKINPPPLFTKKLATTWTWLRRHDMTYLLNVSQPAYKKVPGDSPIKVGAKDYWEFKQPMSWHEADKECRAAGLKLAQPKTHKEVIALQRVLHNRIHGRDPGCKDDTKWTRQNGYCFISPDGFQSRVEAIKSCKDLDAILPFPALGNHTAWQEAIATWSTELRTTTGRAVGTPHAGANKALDGQWLWEDESVVPEESWTPGKPSGDGDCSVLNAAGGLLMDKICQTTWRVACQGKSNSHWLGALGSADVKCVEWVGGKCIEEEDHEHDKHIIDLWQTEPDDILTEEEEYALQLQIEHDKPFTLRKTSDKRPFICESACPLGFVNYGTQCLLVKKFWLPWREAAASCIEMGLQLYEPEDKQAFKLWLKQTRQFNETYWIGSSEGSFTGKTVDMNNIKKLQFICGMVQGTRKMNVTNQLSYSDEQKDFKIPKFETKCSNRTVTVYERVIEETYPFSVQMDITGWMWVEYNKETDEHGSNQCDNNNDWVGGEDCWAHSKWGYSTSYLQNGDEICAHGDNARLTLSGTVTYKFNQHEVKVDNEECEPDRSKRSVREKNKRRRSKRSVASEKSINNIKAKANSQELDDSNKPLMSYIGKRAAEWVRAQAKERNAHLVEYHIDKLSPIVTDMSLEEEEEGLMTPGSIFEEEFENTGSTNVITTFKKTKTISNSYRWSVKKGLNIEDSHISSYSMMDTESGSNSFSVGNNIAQKEGTSQSTNQGKTDSEGSSAGNSETHGRGSKSIKSATDQETTSKGVSSEIGRGQEKSLGEEVSEGATSITGSQTGVSKTAGNTDTVNRGTSDTSSITQGTSNTDSQSITKTKSDTSSLSSTSGSSESSSNSQTSHSERGSSTTTGGETKTRKSGVSFLGLSFGASYSYKTPQRTESTRSSETSTSSSSKASLNSRTSSSSQTSGSTNSQTAAKTKSEQNTKEIGNTVNVGASNTNSESVTQDITQTDQNESEIKKIDINKVSQTVKDVNTIDVSTGQSRGISDQTSLNVENQNTLTKTQDRVRSIEEKLSKNQESIRSMESTYGRNVAKGSEESQGNQKSRTQQVTLDKNEDVETSAQEVLDTQNEVVIPPRTKVKIEWNVEQRKVRLPWKASVVLTGWINVRFKNIEDEVCDIFHETDRNPYSNTSWTYNYTKPCEKDNRLYGYPLSYLADKNFIKEGNGLRFTTSGVFDAIVATSHFLRVTETPVYDYNDNDNDSDSYDDETNESRRRRRSPRILPSDYDLEYDDYDEEPRVSRRRKPQAPRRLPSKVTEYPMDFDENGNGKVDMGRNNRHFRKFHAKKNFNGMH